MKVWIFVFTVSLISMIIGQGFERYSIKKSCEINKEYRFNKNEAMSCSLNKLKLDNSEK